MGDEPLKGTRVLITYGWCRTAYAAAISLARRGCVVGVTDPSPWAMTKWSRFARHRGRTADPFSTPARYREQIGRLARKWGAEVVLPAHEDGLVLREGDVDLPSGCRIACPPAEAMRSAMDKGDIGAVAERAGVSTPPTAAPRSLEEAIDLADEIGYPVVVKPRRGNSGKGVRRADTRKELVAAWESLQAMMGGASGRAPLLQGFVRGPLAGGCFISTGGTVHAVFTERYLRCKGGDFGTSVWRERTTWPRLETQVGAMARALSWTGIGQFDFIGSPELGEPCLIEMNPRLWGAINLALLNGFDFPAALVAQTRGVTDLQRYFVPAAKSVRSQWIIGELILAANELAADGIRTIPGIARRFLGSRENRGYDDFRWHDPLPLLAEALDYGRRYVRAGFDSNPVSEGMLG